ncbi:hypothetical protein D3C75_717360 [compost metagenome]
MRGEPVSDLLVGFAERRLVGVGDFMRHHAAAGKTFPNEILPWQSDVLIRAHKDVRVVTRLLHNLHQPPAVAEGIEIDCRRRPYAELFAEITPARQHLACERFARRHVAVRLQIPAAHDMPSALPHQPLDAGEQRRFVFLDPLI